MHHSEHLDEELEHLLDKGVSRHSRYARGGRLRAEGKLERLLDSQGEVVYILFCKSDLSSISLILSKKRRKKKQEI